MWRYLKAAFLSRVEVPGLGQIPANILGLSAFAILGVGQPAFWFLGLGLEITFLFSLAFNRRFQKVIDAKAHQSSASDAEARRQALIRLLDPDAQRRLSALETKCRGVLDIYRHQQLEDIV